MIPQRIQRRRVRGWKAPAGAVYVGRGSKWGNPWKTLRLPAGQHAVVDVNSYMRDGRLYEHFGIYPNRATALSQAAAIYGNWLGGWHVSHHPKADAEALVAQAQTELIGKDLMCWCVPGQPCHADILLRLANMPNNPEGSR